MGRKYSKKELDKIMKNINKQIFIGDETYIEEFRQIKINGEYIPYVISSFGRIFSLFFGKSDNFNVKEIKPNSNSTSYIKITIHYNNKHYNCWIHRLLAEAFILNPENKSDVNHKDGIKTHNYIWNLEWNTHKENVDHAERNHFTNHPRGENNHSKMSEETVLKICKMILKNKKPSYIISKNDITINMFQQILHQRKWKYITLEYDFSNYKYLRKRKNKS